MATKQAADLSARIGWAKEEVRDRWAAIMAELGIPYEISDPTSPHAEAAGRAMTDRYGDDEHPSYFRAYDDWGLRVTTATADAWETGKRAAKAAPKSESTAIRRAALAAAIKAE
jgi:hypothetical protein